MKRNENQGILLFIKYPEIDKVKSRLSKSIDKRSVVTIYKLFVEDILIKLKDTPYDKIICYYPENDIDKFKGWLGENYLYVPQIGRNLGERLKNCFKTCFLLGYSKLVAIGSDSPDLKLDIIIEAIEKIDNYHAVIGPCIDGGYYLIGFSKKNFYPDIFNDMPWSTKEVFKMTIDVFSKANRNVHILPEWYDVDTINDLFDLYKKNLKSDFKNTKTMMYLTEFYKKQNQYKN
jgi:rSAM/selenodomain-associated transferase 1